MKTLLITVILALCFLTSFSQSELKGFEKYIFEKSKYIFEGKIIDRKFYYDGNKILTSNIVRINAIFRGSETLKLGTIDVVTSGGQRENGIWEDGGFSYNSIGLTILFFCTTLDSFYIQSGVQTDNNISVRKISIYDFYSGDLKGVHLKKEDALHFYDFLERHDNITIPDVIKMNNTKGTLRKLPSLEERKDTVIKIDTTGFIIPKPAESKKKESIVTASKNKNTDTLGFYLRKKANLQSYNAFMAKLEIKQQQALNNQQRSVQSTNEIYFAINNVQETGTTPSYLEFDIDVWANNDSTYFDNVFFLIKYNVNAFGSNLIMNDKIFITKGTDFNKTTYYDPIATSHVYTDSININFSSDDNQTNLNRTKISTSPNQLLHFKIEILDCNQDINLQFINQISAQNSSFYTLAPNDAILAFHKYDATHYPSDLNYILCETNIVSFTSPVYAGTYFPAISVDSSLLVIKGSRFGDTRGKGNVYFVNANKTNGSYTQLNAMDFLSDSWTDNEIKIHLPSRIDTLAEPSTPGSGYFYIITDSEDTVWSNTPINIPYAVLNSYINDTSYGYTKARYDLVNENDSVSYTIYLGSNITENPDTMIEFAVKSAIIDWKCQTRVPLKIGYNSGDWHANQYDGKCVIELVDNIPDYPDALAVHNPSSLTCHADVFFSYLVKNEFDIRILKDPTTISDNPWYYNPNGNLPANYSDFYATVLHELGHALCLAHVTMPDTAYNKNELMYWASFDGPINADDRLFISTNDTNGVNNIKAKSKDNRYDIGACSLTPFKATDKDCSSSIGIEDHVSFGGYYCSTNPTVISNGQYANFCATFYDEADYYGNYGDYAISWDWKIELDYVGGTYTKNLQTTNVNSIEIPLFNITLPDYDWVRDANGNIKSRIKVSALDNDGYTHNSYLNIALVYKPNKPLIHISNPTCTTATLSFYSRGATGYKIYYSKTKGGPYTATGISQGNSPITAGNVNTYNLSGFNGTYYFVVRAINSVGESISSDEVRTPALDVMEYTAQNTETWQPGVGNNPFNSVSGIVSIGSKLIIPDGKTITIKNMLFSFDQDAAVYVKQSTSHVVGIGSTKLILDNTIFTTIDICNNTTFSAKWKGIIAEANTTVELINNSKIERAQKGINLYSSAVVSVSNSILSSCTNAIYTTGTSNITITDASFTGNNYAINTNQYSVININNSTFSSNTNAIYAGQYSVTNMSNLLFNNNSTANNAYSNSKINATNCTYNNNSTSISLDNYADFKANKCYFNNNQLAAYLDNHSILKADSCLFRQNFDGVYILSVASGRFNSSTFIDNKTSVSLYNNYNNNNIINKCNFIATDTLYNYPFWDGASNPFDFINLNYSEGVKITACNFNNNAIEDYGTLLKGTAINATQSGVTITGCTSRFFNCTSITPNTFENLTDAIKIINDFNYKKINIRNNIFKNITHSIYLYGCLNPTVVFNSIELGIPNNTTLSLPVYDSNSTLLSDDLSYGIFLDYSTGYKVQENTFNSNNSYPAKIGLIVEGSGSGFNEIYRNIFDSLPYATLFLSQFSGMNKLPGTGGNDDPPAPSNALEIKCNTFSNNIYDIASSSDNGFSNIQGSVELPAGNLFSQNYDNQYNIYDSYINYYYKAITDYELPYSTSSNISIYQSNTTLVWDEYCKQKISNGILIFNQLIANRNSYLSNYNQLTIQYNSLVDDNKTDWFLKKIDKKLNPQALKNKLLNASPWLSDTVMTSLIAQNNYFTNNDLTQVLVQNPQSAISPKVQSALNSMNNPLSYPQRMQINSQDTVLSPLTSMQAQISSLINQSEYYVNEIINYFLSDTLPTAKDSLIDFFASQNTLEFDYKLFTYYYTIGQNTDARNLLSQIPTKYTLTSEQLSYYNKFSQLYDVLISIKENNLTINDINSSQLSIIRSLAQDTLSLSGNIAKQIVCKIDSVPFKKWVRLPYEITTPTNPLMGYVYESVECGSSPYHNDTLVLINEYSDTLSVSSVITDNYGFFKFNESEIATINPDEVVTIATKSGYKLQNPEYKTLTEWLQSSPISLTLSNSNLEWADLYSTVDSLYNGGTVLDLNGNLYVAGYTNTALNYSDFLIIKYSPTGERLWVNTYNGSANYYDRAVDIAVDAENNCYVIGNSFGTNTLQDIVLLKYSPDGNLLWEKRINGSAAANDEAKSVAIDASNNVYITATLLNNSTGNDIVTYKYSKTGQLKWQKTYSTTNNEYSTAIKIDNAGNIIVAGYGTDYIILKYNSNGVQQWFKQYDSGTNDIVYDLAVDANNNIIITGSTTDITTIKYNSSGIQQWIAHSGGKVSDMVCDNLDNIYISGTINTDAFTVKYNQDGLEQWKSLYNSGYSNGVDALQAIAVDNNNEIYVTGFSATAGNLLKYSDIITIKYNTEGDVQWQNIQSGGYHTQNKGSDIVVSENNNVYITGVKYDNSLYKMATLKYSQCPSTANLKVSILKPDVTSNNQTLEDIVDDELIQVINFQENKVIVYPNPYIESTRIELIITSNSPFEKGVRGFTSEVSLEVFTMGGQKVADVFKGNVEEGRYNYTFSAKKLGYSAGTYILQITINNQVNSYWLVEMK